MQDAEKPDGDADAGQGAQPGDAVAAQYEAFPYPSRDPAEEATRLIEGSPSFPVEIDHYLFGGRRDWSRPFRALVAGGGTGDGLVMLAQRLADIGCPAEITYLDLSGAARRIAEARIAARGLSVRFVTADLAEAPALAPLGGFDYIDCCGVLHHLPDPDLGFRALAEAVSPEGGLGLMVYAPHGRSGVYPLQAAFGALLDDVPVAERPALARPVIEALRPTHPLARNPLVGDHRSGGDAGLYDLLLHARDRPYLISELDAALARAGLSIVSAAEPGRYEPERYLPDATPFAARLAAMTTIERMALAENLSGAMKTHVVYAVPEGRAPHGVASAAHQAVPRLRGGTPDAMAGAIKKHGRIKVTRGAVPFVLTVDPRAASLIAAIDGRRDLAAIAESAGMPWLAFLALWGPAARALSSFGLLHYSRGGAR
ncbi:MAG: class I SAM-dependent methyltransferase [Pseudomonadota bacterium]